jgi:hypothetical protein
MTKIVGSRPRKSTNEAVLTYAKKINSKSDWKKASKAYAKAHRQGWLEEACHRIEIKWEARWDRAAVMSDASKLGSRSSWDSSGNGAVGASHRRHREILCIRSGLRWLTN